MGIDAEKAALIIVCVHHAMEMFVHTQISVTLDVGKVRQDQPFIFFQQIDFPGHGKPDRMSRFSRFFLSKLTVTVPVFSFEAPDIHIKGVNDPLDYMKGIHYRGRIGKVFVDKSDIGIIHVGDKIADFFPFFDRNGRKVGFGHLGLSAPEDINRIAGIKILYDKSVFTVRAHVHINT